MHPGSHVTAHELRQSKRGPVGRFLCNPGVGEPHSFSVLLAAVGEATVAQWSPPPVCPRHAESKVVRNGTYGKTTPKPRQRYRCTPADGSKPHAFTPMLPRDHVHDGEEHCDHCEELRGIHRGETAVARRHSWSTRIVARGLEQLAIGATYADVSRWAIRVSGTKRIRKSVAPAAGASAKKKRSAASKESQNCWHIAADWVEAFGPVVYGPVDAELRERALAERDRLDALIAAGQPLERPQVVLIDDVPVYGRNLDDKKRSRRDAGYFVLVAAELLWPDQSSDDDAHFDPFAAPTDPVIKLRLVRTMAKSNTQSWRLVFDELGYHPDFVVADAGTGIAAAIAAHYDPARTRFIPSLWHVAQAVELSLADTPGAFIVTAAGKELVRPLAEHVRKLSRTSGVLATTATWSSWWDELLALLRTHKLPIEKVQARRRSYEPAMASALAALAANPQVPVSTGGLETLIAKQVKPLLAMRRASFGNIERTNTLFDLVVARQHNAFDNLGDVAKLLRVDSEHHDGWTVPLRSISDPRPKGGSYSSLRDATLLNTLASQRGLT